MNTKINYRWTNAYDQNEPNNGFNEEVESIVTDGYYGFSDFLQDRGIEFEKEFDSYYVIDENGNRTGEVYQIISEEVTSEKPRA